MAKKKQSGGALALAALIGALALAAGYLLDRSALARVGGDRAADLGALRISEVQTDNWNTLRAADGAAPAWIEIENTGRESVSLRGAYLQKDLKVARAFVFPDIELAGGGFLVVFAGETVSAASPGALVAPFNLPPGGGEAIMLLAPDQTVIDSVALPRLTPDAAYCRADGGWAVTQRATPGAANVVSDEAQITASMSTGRIELSEIMTGNPAFYPDENGLFHDYVELHNASGQSVSLKGWRLSDNHDKPDKWTLPDVTLPPDGYFVVYCSGLNRADDPARPHANFRLSAGEPVCLSAPDGALAALVTPPALESGQAYSLSEGVWTAALPPTPGAENAAGSADRLNALGAAALNGVYISEILALPASDEEADWVEICNGGGAAVDLSGWGLSDRLGRLRKWQLPAGTTLAPGERLTVTCSPEVKGALAAPFSLSGDGGYAVCLCDAAGVLADCVSLPRQYAGASYGREAGGRCGYFADPTPGAANGAALNAPAEGAAYSVSGGVFRTGDSFAVSLSAAAGARIYYTLDCADPDESSRLYDGSPIAVSSTTILRTRVYRDGCLPSLSDTQSYLFDVDGGREVSFVVSLVSDPENLYSDEKGILVKGPNATDTFPFGSYGRGANFWMDWEREAHVDLFDHGGEAVISQGCGVKVHGRNSRGYDLKCLKVIARNRYGESLFSYPIFGDRPYGEYEAFLIRCAGQDYKYTFMRDAVLTSLAADTSVLYQEAEEGVCYINGEYYSAVYVRENVSAWSIARAMGWEGQEEDIDLVKSSKEVMQGSDDTYLALKDWLAAHDTTTQEAFDVIDAAIDVDNFAEYIALQVYLGPPDTVNVKRFRNQNTDGKWRWVLYDVDRALRDDVDGFALLAQGTNSALFKACMSNPLFQERFFDCLNRLLATTLSSGHVTALAQAQYGRIRPVLPAFWEKTGMTEKKYEAAYKGLLKMISGRPAKVIENCRDWLKLTDDDMRRLLPDAFAAIEAWEAAN
ncbi:MAG: lamin tail domain-containing protein [Clostridia bacterium]|nr:lamin tail domain-containing protein [Clostridia bacterium]